MPRRILRLVQAICIAALALTMGCGLSIPADPDDTLARVTGTKLRVGVSPNPPWTELGETGPRGTEAELVNAFAQNPHRLFAEWSQLGQVLSVVIPTAIYVAIIPWAGIYLSSLILIALFMMWLGRYGIAMSATLSIGVTVAIYLLFEKWFLVPLPKGPIEDYFSL